MGTSVPFMFIGSCVLASFEKVLNNVAEDFDGDIWRFLRVSHSDPDIVVSSVSDPYHFDSDPDPDLRIRIREDGSGSEVTFDSVNRIFPIKCYARL